MSEEAQQTDKPRASIYDVFETDTELENNGVVFDCGFGKFRVAYVGNPDFVRELAAAMKPYSEANARGLLDDGFTRKILIDVYARTIVRGWEGVVGRDGQPLPYSTEACVKLMSDLPRLFSMVREWAANFANYRRSYVESVTGN